MTSRCAENLITISRKNPTYLQAERAIETVIKENLSLRKRLKRTSELSGIEALEEIFDHPMIRIPVDMIKLWIEPD